jgi:hypothetical protein
VSRFFTKEENPLWTVEDLSPIEIELDLAGERPLPVEAFSLLEVVLKEYLLSLLA